MLRFLLIRSGNVKTNPGPYNTKSSNLSIDVWNLDSIPASDYARIPLIETLQATYNFDIFGICESSLTGNISNDDIFISGFSPQPFRSDKPALLRNGGVCLYYKENLPIKERGDLEILDETIVAEIKVKPKNIFFVLSYCHPNQTLEEVNLCMHKLEHIYESIKKENPAVTIICGDYNATLFWENDITNWEGRIFSDFLLSNNLEELVNESIHIRDDGSQSCIDLICSDQPYIFTEIGVLPSIDSHSKHNIVHRKLNFKFPPPPPYKRKVWNYRAAKVDLIHDQVDNVNWNDLFHNLNVNEMCLSFTDVFWGVMSSNTSNKTTICNDKDAP